MKGGNFSLSGGFLVGALPQAIYLPYLTKP